jgi:hypothetical protein
MAKYTFEENIWIKFELVDCYGIGLTFTENGENLILAITNDKKTGIIPFRIVENPIKLFLPLNDKKVSEIEDFKKRLSFVLGET